LPRRASGLFEIFNIQVSLVRFAQNDKGLRACSTPYGSAQGRLLKPGPFTVLPDFAGGAPAGRAAHGKVHRSFASLRMTRVG
jgi:hypothetical protein